MRSRLISAALSNTCRFLVFFTFACSAFTAHAERAKLTISIPGPGNMLFMPIELAKKIGADTAENAELDIRFFGGGPQAYKDMLEKNSDFSAGGIPALAEQRSKGNPVVCIAPISQVPGYSLIVRSDLKGKVKTIADMKGHVIGVKGHTKGGRSTTQMFTEYILLRNGMAVDSVSFVAAGQSYQDQHAALASGTVDMIMGDEPFATRMKKEGVGFYLGDFYDTRAVKKILGGMFLNAQIASREDFVAAHPDMVEKMVKINQRTLLWIRRHSALQIVDALNLPTAEARDALRETLTKYKEMYSPDGSFSNEQIRTTEEFFHTVSQDDPAARSLSFSSFINDKWAGRVR